MKMLIKFSSSLITVIGILLMLGGFSGIGYTYRMVAREKITTPMDASIPNAPVGDPISLKIQADTIRKHTLATTNDQTFAEMPREIAQLDSLGKPVLDSQGNTVMVPNNSRNIWITATTLTTALNLAILSYAFCGLSMLIGFVFVLNGLAFSKLMKR